MRPAKLVINLVASLIAEPSKNCTGIGLSWTVKLLLPPPPPRGIRPVGKVVAPADGVNAG